MANQVQNPKWVYNLELAGELRPGRRLAQPPGTNYELVGADGSVDGGARRLNGVRLVTRLTGNLGTSTTQQITGFFPISFSVSYNQFGHGYLYRVRDTADDRVAFFLEYKFGNCPNWIGPVNLIGTETDAALGTNDMDVVVFGRFVYVFVKGHRPFTFYLADVEESETEGGLVY